MQENNHEEPVRTNSVLDSIYTITHAGIPIVASNYLLIREIGKEGMLVRKFEAAHFSKANMPNRIGFYPKNPLSQASIAEHVLNLLTEKTQYISASENFPKGAPNFNGTPNYIDIHRAKMSGCIIYSSEDVIAELLNYKLKHPHLSVRIDNAINTIRTIERESLILPGPSGKIPANAVYTPNGYNSIKRYGRIVGWVGIALVAVDLGSAAHESIKLDSAKPIAAEAIRQAGSWGAAWIGAKAGALAGVALSAPTGPGAIVGGLIGGIIFGAAGYFGADWVADFIYEN